MKNFFFRFLAVAAVCLFPYSPALAIIYGTEETVKEKNADGIELTYVIYTYIHIDDWGMDADGNKIPNDTTGNDIRGSHWCRCHY